MFSPCHLLSSNRPLCAFLFILSVLGVNDCSPCQSVIKQIFHFQKCIHINYYLFHLPANEFTAVKTTNARWAYQSMMCLCVCVWVWVWERERERERTCVRKVRCKQKLAWRWLCTRWCPAGQMVLVGRWVDNDVSPQCSNYLLLGPTHTRPHLRVHQSHIHTQ